MAKRLVLIDGAECSVETGTGTLTSVGAGKRNVEVVFAADHAKLQHPPKAWLDTQDRVELHRVAEEARSHATRVAYRIVVRRKPNIDPALPLEQVDRTQRIRDLDGLALIGPEGTFPAGWDTPAGSTPAPVSTEPSGGPARREEPSPPTAEPTPPPVDEDGSPADPGDPGPVEPDVGPTAPQGAPGAAPGADGKHGPRMAEPRPWEPYQLLPGGQTTINLASYAVQAVEGLVLLAHDLLLAKARVDSKTDGRPFAPPTHGQIRGLARRLLTAADRVQANLRPDGHYDRMDMSHTRARAAVRAALEAHPVPWGVSNDDLAVWGDELVDYATGLMNAVLVLVGPGEAS